MRLEALPGGRAELNLTFQLPSASEVVPPPSHVPTVPAPQRPIIPLFPKGCFPQGTPPDPKLKSASVKVFSKQRKSYRRSVLHRAALAAPSLPPPSNGSLRQAAQAAVERLKADPVLSRPEVNISSTRKRAPYSSPSHQSPLAQRMRSDFQIGESEVESPEKELLRNNFSPENFPSPTISPPNVKGFSSPAPLAFTPLSLTSAEVDIARSDFLVSAKAVEVEPVNVDQLVKVCEAIEEVKVAQEESDWETIKDSENDCETIEDSENDFPAIDVNCEDWAEKYTESVHRFHTNGKHRIVDEQEEKCPNCDRVFTPHHQCSPVFCRVHF